MTDPEALESALSALMQTAHELYPIASAQAEFIEASVQAIRDLFKQQQDDHERALIAWRERYLKLVAEVREMMIEMWANEKHIGGIDARANAILKEHGLGG